MKSSGTEGVIKMLDVIRNIDNGERERCALRD